MQSTTCKQCGNDFPMLEDRCPHCARPSRFPSVEIAGEASQVAALDVRYDAALKDAQSRSTEGIQRQFESEVESDSVAVISVSMLELHQIADSESRVFSTYYDRVQAGLQIPPGGRWDVLRGIAEHSLYQHKKENIRFAALSLDKIGVKNYGECSVTLSTEMIRHRTIAFEENNVVFTVYDQQASMKDAESLEKGYVAVWESRGKLAVAKLTPKITDSMTC